MTISTEKDNTMCGNEEFVELAGMFNEFHTFTLWGIRHILNSTDVDKVTWFTNNSANTSGRSDSYSFVDTLHSAGLTLFTKNHRTMGNFVLTGKRGFDILRQMGRPRFDLIKGRYGILDSLMRVYYIPSMDDNRFIVSVYEPLYFKNDSDYKSYFKMYQNMDDMIVGEIIDGERPNDSVEEKSRADDKHETVDAPSIKRDSKTHLIFGYHGCGKTTYIRHLINNKIQNSLGVCVLTSAYSAKTYFKKEDKNLHIFTIADILTFLSDIEKNPTTIALAIVNCAIANLGRFNLDTIAVDWMDTFISSINSDYSEDEYFRELSKCCKENKINLLYTKGVDKRENDSSYPKIPTIFERFSDIITVLK